MIGNSLTRPTLHFKERTHDNPVISAERILISASVEPTTRTYISVDVWYPTTESFMPSCPGDVICQPCYSHIVGVSICAFHKTLNVDEQGCLEKKKEV